MHVTLYVQCMWHCMWHCMFNACDIACSMHVTLHVQCMWHCMFNACWRNSIFWTNLHVAYFCDHIKATSFLGKGIINLNPTEWAVVCIEITWVKSGALLSYSPWSGHFLFGCSCRKMLTVDWFSVVHVCGQSSAHTLATPTQNGQIGSDEEIRNLVVHHWRNVLRPLLIL